MGCWNGTCLLSNMPILEGEDVLVIPTAHTKRHGLRMILTPMYGFYDGYGGATIYPTSESFCVNEFLDKHIIERLDPKLVLEAKERHEERNRLADLVDKGDKEAGERCKDVLISIYKNRKKIDGSFILREEPNDKKIGPNRLNSCKIILCDGYTGIPEEADVHLLMVRKDVWEAMKKHVLTVSTFTHFLPKGEKDPTTGNGWTDYTGADYLEKSLKWKVRHFHETDLKCLEEAKNTNPEFVASESCARWRRMSVETSIQLYTKIDELRYDESVFINLFAPDGTLSGLLESSTQEMLKDIWCLGIILTFARKNLEVPAGTGSQTQDFAMMKALGEAMTEIASKKLAEKKEYI